MFIVIRIEVVKGRPIPQWICNPLPGWVRALRACENAPQCNIKIHIVTDNGSHMYRYNRHDPDAVTPCLNPLYSSPSDFPFRLINRNTRIGSPRANHESPPQHVNASTIIRFERSSYQHLKCFTTITLMCHVHSIVYSANLDVQRFRTLLAGIVGQMRNPQIR